MSAQIAVIISQADLQKMIDQKVEAKFNELQKSFTIERDLPVRMSCKEAAAHLNISESTFHRHHSHLKQYEGRTVFVLAKDLK